MSITKNDLLLIGILTTIKKIISCKYVTLILNLEFKARVD
jgi:hypothetical protein